MIEAIERTRILFGLFVFSCAFGFLAQHAFAIQMQAEQVRLTGPEKITFHSEVLGEERTILVRVPEEYAEAAPRKYPVLYVLDGEYFFRQAVAAVQFNSELGYDRGQHPVPQMIVVGIVNVDRDRDYTPTHAPSQSGGRLSFPTSGGAKAFLKFLETEVFPLVETRYRAYPDRILSGWSLGGLFTVHTYLYNPSLFSRCLAISPSMWWDDALFVKNTKARLDKGDSLSMKPLVITLGSLEGGDMNLSVRKGFVPLLMSLDQSKLTFTFTEITNEGHNYVPYKAYYDGLVAAFADWRVPAEVLGEGLAAVEKFYRVLADRYGCPVDVPLSVYLQLSTTLQDIESALEAARRAVEEYPYSSLAHAALGRLQAMAGDNTAAVKSLKKALEIELARPVMQSENLKAIRGRLRGLEGRAAVDGGE
ncbi:MAG TPA: alpha/beta hydrolase-fold protein [Acidobacteriota bacterium]|nr:alpha/beta hydrolase-fold protein [Acidobacteriota bacterium]